ncbi:hypothetical protein IQ07DRAFT_588326, partial [Pyrenochaeta sp. DS3sAY3a]
MTSKLWAPRWAHAGSHAGFTRVSRLGAIPALRLLGRVSTRGELPYTMVKSDFAVEKPVVLVLTEFTGEGSAWEMVKVSWKLC